jgi:hypothetical protein
MNKNMGLKANETNIKGRTKTQQEKIMKGMRSRRQGGERGK